MDRTQIGVGAAALVAIGGIDVLAHLGPTGLVIGGLAAFVAYRHAPDVLGHLPEEGSALPSFAPAHPGSRSIADRLLGRFPEEEVVPVETSSASVPEEEEYEPYNDEDELEVFNPGMFTLSQVLRDFTPSLRNIYLGSLPDGTSVYSDAKGLCHVALGGSTGGGKSSLIRLLMSQLCKSGASVLLLNPHYTRYDIEHHEDWTPFEPYLVHDPMECRKYEVIEHYLKQVATVLLPKRLEKYARSQPLGKPYFLVIDELPAIVANIPDAPKYLATILREGRKVGIFLITAAQDFLVKTIAPQANQGGGAIRDCYRTAYYVGGDPTTAKVLLDVPAKEIQESVLGKGMAMLRSTALKVAKLVRVPYVDNAALYTLLGPSTYTSFSDEQVDDDLFLEDLQPQQVYTETHYQVMPPMAPNTYREVPRPMPEVRPSTSPTHHQTAALTPQLQRAYDTFQSGMSDRALGRALNIHHATAAKYVQLLMNKGLIDENRQKKSG